MNGLRVALPAITIAVMAGSLAGKTRRETVSAQMLSIHLYDRAQVSAEVLRLATMEASRLFRAAGASGACCRAANLTVFFAGGGVVPNAVTYTAKVQVTQMFREVGIGIDWHRQPSTGTPAGVRVEVTMGRPETDHPRALAYTTPYSGSPVITLMYDRLQRAVTGRPSLLPTLLAHVLAHEIGHILKGNGDHAAVGVMKARWTDADYDEMAKRPLSFTAADQRMMRIGLGLPVKSSEP